MPIASRLGLRTKLALALGGLLVIVAVLGVYAIVLLSRLGPAIDVVLRENYRSVIAMEDAKEALERLDSGALYALAGHDDEARALRTEHDLVFRDALATELGNITIPGEGARAQRLADLYGDYIAALDRLLAAPVEEREGLYFDHLLPRFTEIKGEADAILALNQETMAEANAAALRQAMQARQRMLLLLLLAGLVAVGFVAATTRFIVRPLRRLTASVREVQGGHLDVVVPVETQDELGRLAEAFNAMAAHLREIRRSDHARLVRLQQATQLAVDHLPDAVAVLSPDGEVELANETARRLFHLRPGVKPEGEEYVWLSLLLDAVAAGRVFEEERFDEAIQIFDHGEERFFLPQAVPIRDEDRLLTGVLFIFSDVTGLRHAFEARSGLLTRLAHELGSPLTSLRIALHLLLEEKVGALEPKQVELLLAARDDADRLTRLTGSLLDLARSAGPDVTETGEEDAATRRREEGMDVLVREHPFRSPGAPPYGGGASPDLPNPAAPGRPGSRSPNPDSS